MRICAFTPGEVLAQVGDLKIKDSIRLLKKRLKTDYGVDVSKSLIVWVRMTYGGARRNMDEVVESRIRNILL